MKTLDEVNTGLKDIGISTVLSMESATALVKICKRDDFVTALKQAIGGNNQSKGFIETILAKLDLAAASEKASNLRDDPAHIPEKQQNKGGGKDKSTTEREYLCHHVYGNDALCFQIDETQGGFPTVRLEAAKAAEGKRKKWDDKIAIQLTKDEMPVVMGVLMKVRQKCEFKAHGPAKDKGFTMEVQGDKVFCRVYAKDKAVVNVPIPYPDRVHVTALFYRQMQQAYSWMDGMSLSALIKI